MKKNYSIIVMGIGILLIFIGMLLKVPGKELTTYSSLDGVDNYSAIKEYVGGDAYNYIIGASLVGAEISGVIASKATYISVGALVFCIGLLSLSFVEKKKDIPVAQETTNQPNQDTNIENYSRNNNA